MCVHGKRLINYGTVHRLELWTALSLMTELANETHESSRTSMVLTLASVIMIWSSEKMTRKVSSGMCSSGI